MAVNVENSSSSRRCDSGPRGPLRDPQERRKREQEAKKAREKAQNTKDPRPGLRAAAS